MIEKNYLNKLQEKKKSARFDTFLNQLDRVGNCPVRITNDVIGGKWKPVIFNLLLHDVNRFGEMLHLVQGLSKKVLTTQLRELESDDIILRKVYDQLPQKVEYEFTAAGKSLIPVIEAMCLWGLNKPA